MQDLRRNWEAGIVYHRADGLKGDYDAQLDERAVMDMLAFGRDYDPYATCPVFETDHFRLRLVCQGDAADLLACYADPLVRPIFNADNCTSDFCYDTVEEMSACIQFFMDMYEQRCFVRWSILDKHSGRAVGTMEMFSGDGEFGVLRIDLASAYEKEPFLHELLSLANERFHLLFQTEAMVVKAIPQAQERRKALEKCGYVPFAIEGREHFFVHRE